MSDTPRETRSQDPDETPANDTPTDARDVTSDDRDVTPTTADGEGVGTGADDRAGAGAADDVGADTADGAGTGSPDTSSHHDTSSHYDDAGHNDDATQVMDRVDEPESESRRVTRDELYARQDRQGEQDRLAAVRAEHEAATNPAEPVPAPAATDEAASGRSKKLKYPRTTDRFFPSLGLLLLRLTMAVVFGVHGVQKLLAMEQTSQFFASLSFFGTPLPYPSILALATGVAEVMIAVSLAFGFLVRFASVGVLLISIGALLMVRMTTLPNPLEAGATGISGELELVLAGVGALLLCVGGGAWALDRLFRRGRYSKDPQDLIG